MRERLVRHLEQIWPQTVSVAHLHLQYNICDAPVEQHTFTDLINIHRHHARRKKEDNVEAIKILMDKINDPDKINRRQRFNKTLEECDIILPLDDLVDF